MIPFNAPHPTGQETRYIAEAIRIGKLSGNGEFTKRCQGFFEARYGFSKCLLTASCTDALEMCAMLAGIAPGDEVIVPSYTFVSTALAFVRQGAKIVFADSRADHPNIDAGTIEALITPRTKAIVPMHYAGAACDMGEIMRIAEKRGLLVIEDAAQALDSLYVGREDEEPRALGGIGHMSAFSFHDTKNITCGEGGMIAINDGRFAARAETVWEKGTNRADFLRGKVSKYGWVDCGSSFLPSEITAAFLLAQLERLDDIQAKRLQIYSAYLEGLSPMAERGAFAMSALPSYATNNAHMFYIVCNSLEERGGLIERLKERGIGSAFHYQSLHKSEFYRGKHDGRELANCDRFSDCLVRLPMFYDLTIEDVGRVCREVGGYYGN
jgi:dTDP-4-amino-4,6-dideoxygalactose transaminase